jgi:imidazolonepropionase-like amidohydrolase
MLNIIGAMAFNVFKIIGAMTFNPAKAIRRQTSLGSVTVGREADVTILKVILKVI